MNFKQQLESKTNAPMILFLIVIVGLSIAGKLTTETVEAIKWLGGSFFAVRAAANITENLGKSDK